MIIPSIQAHLNQNPLIMNSNHATHHNCAKVDSNPRHLYIIREDEDHDLPLKRPATLGIEQLGRMLGRHGYVSDPSMLTTLYLALKLKKPLLVEGEPGSGKTELAKVLSKALGAQLIRLQCYEGLDASSTIYEWDYLRQLLKIKMEEGRSASQKKVEREVFSERYLLKRPLL